jgi:methionine aminopeptidase
MNTIADRPEITIHSSQDFEGMRADGQLVAEVLDMIGDHARAGITMEDARSPVDTGLT